ncbi:MAG: DUF1501 domain-containing protein [Planctomycetes bacterium]|nr:DUF1501 domain-containing protein [Planctomycetota bacterium]
MTPELDRLLCLTRRQLFGGGAHAAGAAALATLLGNRSKADDARSGALPDVPHHRPTAKRIIHLFMSGAPSQIDMYDHKPELTALFDKDLPESVRQGQRFTTMTSGQKRFPLAPSMFRFDQHGQSGRWVSELLPETAKVVDDLAFAYSVHTNAINHDPAITFIQTGRELPGWPSLGAWLSYGLGTATENLPNYVVMTPTWTGRKSAQALYSRLWGSGFLPSRLQGVALRAQGDPVLFVTNPPGVDASTRRAMLDGLSRLNQMQFEAVGDAEIQSRIAQYEMAFRMQTSVPELASIADEPQHVLDLYGPDATKPGTFAASCLLARRLAERGVQCIQLFHRGWDQHNNLPNDIRNQCRDIDHAARGLIEDLKQRDMLKETLIVWGGEFGRTVYCQGELKRDNYGRDHHPRCFTMWMAGGGIQGGRSIGITDDFSYNVVADPVGISDVNTTILHCLGIDNQRMSVKYQGLDARVTGVEPCRVLTELLA